MKKQYLYIALITIAAMALTSCEHLEIFHKEKPRVVNVNTTTVYNGVFENCNEYVGTLEESYATELCFEGSGRVTAVYVKDGQQVKKGQLIAQIDTTNASNAYHAAKATLDQANDGFARAKQVYDKGSMPEVKWMEIKTQLAQAQSMEQMARKRLEDCWLYAPVAGTISDRNIEVGSTASPLIPVVKIIGMNGMYIKASIPEIDINKIKVGAQAKVQIKAIGDTIYEGVVTERNVSADRLSRGYTVRVKLKGATRDLLPGMVSKVIIADKSESRGYEIPSRAVQIENDGRRFVWLVEDSMATKRYVTINDLTATGVLVSEGLVDGDEIITDGTQKVATGTKVSVVK